MSNNITAKFTQGSIMKHLLVMSSSATVGLAALFFVDLVDMFYLSLLGEQELAAAVGFAGTILFFTSSISIGFAITTGALVSKSIGENKTEMARSYVTSVVAFALLVAMPTLVLLLIFSPDILTLLGAEGRSHDLALSYLYITLPSFPLIMLGMAGSGVLRATGDAKGAMFLTLLGAIVNFALDPLFIFVFNMGVNGAATATVCARIAMMIYAIYKVVVQLDLVAPFSFIAFKKDIKAITEISIPAVITNVSTPITMAYITATVAQFGDAAVAGSAVVSRLVPVAFVGLFALSGVIGPIAGQNWGAHLNSRVKQTLNESVIILTGYVLFVSLLLFLLSDFIVGAFSAEGDTATLIYVLTFGLSLSYIFHGITFVTNALFNNLDKPRWATAFNLGKATIGTIPFAWFGAQYWQAPGVLIGQGVGAVVFGIMGYIVAHYLIKNLDSN